MKKIIKMKKNIKTFKSKISAKNGKIISQKKLSIIHGGRSFIIEDAEGF
jgi:hypothetical protein